MNDAIIELTNVSKSFGGVIANRDVSLTVRRGAITGLIGPNGSGKTTLFNSIVGYHPIRLGFNPLRRPRNFAATRAGNRPARLAADIPNYPHLRENELLAEHADLNSASQGRFLRHVRLRAG